MTFRINGIKQKQTDTTPIVLVVETDSELLVRKLLEKYNILILSINEYTADPKLFGDVWAKIKRWFDGITVVSTGTSVEEVCEKLLDLWLEIAEINSFTKPLSKEEVQMIFDSTLARVQARQTAEQQIISSRKEEQKKIYDDPKLARSKVIVEWIFARIPMILQSLWWDITSQEIKHINVLQEDLKKLRMGNNYEKIRDLASEILTRMQQMEEVTLSLHPEQAKNVIDGSIVTDQDIQREEMRLLYTQQKKILWAKISLVGDDYALFGSLSLFRKFFQKDLWHMISSPSKRLYYLHDTALICVGFLLSLAGIFVVYNLLFPTLDNLDGLRLQFIRRWTLGLLLRIGAFWRKKNILNLILLYGATILVYRFLVEFITTNFALVT